MDTEGKRIKKIREDLKLSQDKFGEVFDCGKSFISAVENDKNKLSHDNLVKLLMNYNVNINYILAGIGNPFLTKQDKESLLDNDEIKENVRELIKEELNKRGL